MSIEGLTRREFLHRSGRCVDYVVWLKCERCGAPREPTVLTLPPEYDTPQGRTHYIKQTGPFFCNLCNAEIPFGEQEQQEFLNLCR